jgi:hypothetical protein
MKPQCTPVVPEDYRRLRRGEAVRPGDLCWGTWDVPHSHWARARSTIGRRVWSKGGSIYMGCGDWVFVIRPAKEESIPEIKFSLVKEKIIPKAKRHKLKGKWTLEPAENLPAVVGSSLPEVVAVPTGTEIPYGWRRVKDKEVMRYEGDFARWAGGPWVSVPGFAGKTGRTLERNGWDAIRKMTKRKLAGTKILRGEGIPKGWEQVPVGTKLTKAMFCRKHAMDFWVPVHPSPDEAVSYGESWTYLRKVKKPTRPVKMTKKALAIANTAFWAKRARELKRMHRKDRALLQLSYLT